MSWQNVLQFAALALLLAVTVPLLGRYIANVFGARADGSAPGDRFFNPIERVISYYYHARRDRAHYLYDLIHDNDWSLADLLASQNARPAAAHCLPYPGIPRTIFRVFIRPPYFLGAVSSGCFASPLTAAGSNNALYFAASIS